jgi:hypothetical protein
MDHLPFPRMRDECVLRQPKLNPHAFHSDVCANVCSEGVTGKYGRRVGVPPCRPTPSNLRRSVSLSEDSPRRLLFVSVSDFFSRSRGRASSLQGHKGHDFLLKGLDTGCAAVIRLSPDPQRSPRPSHTLFSGILCVHNKIARKPVRHPEWASPQPTTPISLRSFIIDIL